MDSRKRTGLTGVRQLASVLLGLLPGCMEAYAMARPRTRLPWRYDDQRQEFTTPAGVVTLHELAELRYGLATSHVEGRQGFVQKPAISLLSYHY